MATITVVYGKNELVGLYKSGDLIATHDKHTQRNGDLERYLAKYEEDGHKVAEKKANFARFPDIPLSLKDLSGTSSVSDTRDSTNSGSEEGQNGKNDAKETDRTGQ